MVTAVDKREAQSPIGLLFRPALFVLGMISLVGLLSLI